MDPLLNHPCVRRGFRRISAGGFKIDYCYSTWSALEEAPPNWCLVVVAHHARAVFVFFLALIGDCLVSGQSSRSRSVAARSMLRPHVASFPLRAQDASPQPHPHVASFPSRVSALRFPFPHPRLQSLLAWPHAVSLRVTARTEARPNRCRTRRGRVGRNSDLLLFSKDRSVGEASAAIYRLPSNYQIPH